MSAHALDPIARAAFNAQGAATMGLSPAWDAAMAAFLACDVRARVDEEFGARRLASNDRDREAWDAEARLGKRWREHPEGKAIWERDRGLTAEDDKIRAERFYEPLWDAQRRIAMTPAPSLAAAIWKAAMIEVNEVWNDGVFEPDCVAIIDADFRRLGGDA